MEVSHGVSEEFVAEHLDLLPFSPILRYCGALTDNLALLHINRKVKGLIIGRELDRHAKFIFSALPAERFEFIPLTILFPEGENAET